MLAARASVMMPSRHLLGSGTGTRMSSKDRRCLPPSPKLPAAEDALSQGRAEGLPASSSTARHLR